MGSFAAICAAISALNALHLGLDPAGSCGIPPTPSLRVNPMFEQVVPPPGWLATHLETWPDDRPVYRAKCRTDSVLDEIGYLARIQAMAQRGLERIGGKPQGGILTVLQTQHEADDMRRDIAAAVTLITRLEALPSCTAPAPTKPGAKPTPTPVAQAATPLAAAPPPPATPAAPPSAAATPPPTAAPLPAPVNPSPPPPALVAPAPPPPAPTRQGQAPQPAAVDPPPATPSPPTPPPAPEPPAATPPPETPAPPPAAPAPTPQAQAPQHLVITFDPRVTALTPLGIKAFQQAVAAARAGKNVTLSIDGCGPEADFSNGSPCARRLASLKAMLAQNGVSNPQRLFAPGS